MGTETVPINTKPDAEDSYSVEISHIYLDRPFSIDQVDSVEQFQKAARLWDKPHNEVILFDDYNVTEAETSYEDVLDQLKKLGALPQYYAFEKDLIAYAQDFIENIKVPKIKRQYEVYIDKNNKYPCSLLTSVWYLVRLGYIMDTESVIKPVNARDSYNIASKVVNFLPSYFAEVEEKSKKLIAATNFPGAVDQIENVFFDSDEIDSALKRDLV